MTEESRDLQVVTEQSTELTERPVYKNEVEAVKAIQGKHREEESPGVLEDERDLPDLSDDEMYQSHANQSLANIEQQKALAINAYNQIVQAESSTNWDSMTKGDATALKIDAKEKKAQLEAYFAQLEEAEGQVYSQFKDREGRKLLKMIPEWRDEGTRKEEMNEIKEELYERYGFSKRDINNAMDARLIVMARDAIIGRKPKDRSPGKTVTVKRTKHKINPKQQNLMSLKSRLKKSGKIDDAVRYLAATRGVNR